MTLLLNKLYKLSSFTCQHLSRKPLLITSRAYFRKFASRTMATPLSYPEARRDETCVDTFHGVEILDPYRWLEDPKSEETEKFVQAQNAITEPFISSYPFIEDIRERLKELWDYPKFSGPYKHGDKYYTYKNTGLQNQDVLYVQDSLEAEARVFFDPNSLSDDGTVAISMTEFSEDGKIFAYGLSSSGSGWSTLHFMDVETGNKYPEVLEKIKYSMLARDHTDKGFFYGTYLEQQGTTDGSETLGARDQKLCYHRVGTPQSADPIVAEFPEEPLWRIGAKVSDCRGYLIVMPQQDCRDNLLFFTKLEPNMSITGKLPLTRVVEKFEADYEYVTNDGAKMIFRTNRNAPNYKLICIDFDDYAEDKWTTVLAEDPERVLDWAVAVDGDKFVACYIHDVKNVLELHNLKNGELLTTFPLDVGTIVEFNGQRKQSEIFYQFTSFLTPGIIYHVDLSKNYEPKILHEIQVSNFDPKAYKTSQVFYTSKDGTKIPMFIIMRAGAVLDGSMPALLYGYGGFNVSVQPTFTVSRLVFVENFKGVYAVANIRGGGEYGERWHNAGRLMNKQNVFDDFHCAAEYLVEQGYTSSKKLTIQGGSNGGLLVAACINQRPELYGAAIAHVPVVDMMRFHKFTVGYAWISDYGCAENEEDFKNLLKYSPLHNVKSPEKGQYPATLVLSADHDDLVVPLHTLKLIATLHHVLGKLPQQTNPLLARIETKAGHGRGKPTAKRIEQTTDTFAFIGKTLGIEFYKN